MADVVRVLKVTAMVVSDEEIVVDKMIAASQRRGDVALPSEGRLLVPYFVPGSSLLTEDALNMNTDVDAFRRYEFMLNRCATGFGQYAGTILITKMQQ